MSNRAEKTWTNRDLYLFVADLIKRESENKRTLEEYLRALWKIGQHEAKDSSIGFGVFSQMLKDAFHVLPAPFDAAWPREYRGFREELSGFDLWLFTVLSQVVDLKEMADAGTLASKYRYFGVDAPSGLRWYNFDPCTYLECAVAGTYGGWEPGDDTGRDYVPGPVAVLNDEGKIVSRDPREIEDPIVVLNQVSWDEFAAFLREGQWYE